MEVNIKREERDHNRAPFNVFITKKYTISYLKSSRYLFFHRLEMNSDLLTQKQFETLLPLLSEHPVNIWDRPNAVVLICQSPQQQHCACL